MPVKETQTQNFLSTSTSSFQSRSNPKSTGSNKNNKPIEIVFVKHVRFGGAAYIAGLREGDRPISINNIRLDDKTYPDIIELIENSGKQLDLIVIPSLNAIESTSSSTATTSSPSSTKSSLLLAQNTTTTSKTTTEKSASKLNEDLDANAAKVTTSTNTSLNLVDNKKTLSSVSSSSIDTSNKSNTHSDSNNTNSSSRKNFTNNTNTNVSNNSIKNENIKIQKTSINPNTNNSKFLSSLPLSKSIVAAASSLLTSSPSADYQQHTKSSWLQLE